MRLKNCFCRHAFAFALVLAFVGIAFCESPNSFKGVEWGTSLKNRSDMEIFDGPKKADNLTYYIRKTDGSFIGPAEIEAIYYIAFDDKFFKVFIKTSGENNFTLLGKVLANKFKDSDVWACRTSPEYVFIRFNDNLVEISGSHNRITGDGGTAFVYSPIEKEAKKYEDEQTKNVDI